MKNKFIVLSADALVTEDLELLQTLPNFKKYLAGGVRTESMKSVYPTVTYPAHTCMITGCLAGKTGIVSNMLETKPNAPEWVLDRKYVKVPDIFTAAKRAGLTTASVFWPVTGNHPDVDYLIDEWPGCAPQIPIDEALKGKGSSEEVLKIVRKFQREMPKTAMHPESDYFIVECAAEIIREFSPDLILVHPANVDAARHSSGLFGKAVNGSIEETDEFIGMLCRAAIGAGYGDKLNFILVSDHGQLEAKRVVNLNVLFAQKGWLTTDDGGRVTTYKAWASSQGFSVFVNLREEKYKEEVGAELVRMAQEGVYGFREVLTKEEAGARYGLWGDFEFVLETDGYTAFADETKSPFIATGRDASDYRQGFATHGYQPEKGPQPVFLAKGSVFKENFVGKRGNIYDLAPTLAKAMGVGFYDCDGEARTDLLREKF